MNKKALAILPLLFSQAASGQTAYVNSLEGLNVRVEASTESEILEVLPFGSRVDGVISREWMKVAKGYVHADYLQPEDPMEYLGMWRVTAYADTGQACANGEYPTIGHTIAHNTLPFGTMLYIEGVGVRVVEDRGPDWLGSEWCDLYLGDTATCIQWGDQYRKVYLMYRKPTKEEMNIIEEYGLDPGYYAVISALPWRLIVCSRSDDRNVHEIQVKNGKAMNRRKW